MKRFSVLFAVVLCLPVLACKPQNNNTNSTTVSTPNETGQQPVKIGRACRDDIQKYCANADKRKKCLRENADKLSVECKTALANARGGAGGGAGPFAVCRDDMQKYCAGKFGPDRRDCMKQNLNSFSDACRTVIQERMNRRKEQNGNGGGEE
ncbi:MAG TPA: hypothetical protein VGG10_18130 [Rhizomicrobium sp.]